MATSDYPDHREIAILIARLGPEKFLEVCGEQFAQFGSECHSNVANKARHMQMQFERIGENLRGLAATARSAGFVYPFVLNLITCEMERSKLGGDDRGSAPIWKLSSNEPPPFKREGDWDPSKYKK